MYAGFSKLSFILMEISFSWIADSIKFFALFNGVFISCENDSIILDLNSSFTLYWDNSVYLEISFKKMIISLPSLIIYPLNDIIAPLECLWLQYISNDFLFELLTISSYDPLVYSYKIYFNVI